MEIDSNVGNTIKIVLKNDFTYVGKILSKGDDFLKIRDKYGKIVFILLANIKVVEEVNDG